MTKQIPIPLTISNTAGNKAYSNYKACQYIERVKPRKAVCNPRLQLAPWQSQRITRVTTWPTINTRTERRETWRESLGGFEAWHRLSAHACLRVAIGAKMLHGKGLRFLWKMFSPKWSWQNHGGQCQPLILKDAVCVLCRGPLAEKQ